jgi:hypothetical protein
MEIDNEMDVMQADILLLQQQISSNDPIIN